jgi:hypothetical protein
MSQKMKEKPTSDEKSKDKLPVKRRRASKKKPKDKPKRPLSAYNFFFKEEREKILKQVQGEETVKSDGDDGEDSISDEVLSRLKKEGGKVSFEEMGKLIGQRWKNIDKDRLEQYSALASEDTERYKKEMEAYVERQEAKARTSRSEGYTTSYPMGHPMGYHTGYPTTSGWQASREEWDPRSGFQDAPGGITSAFSHTMPPRAYQHPYAMEMGAPPNFPFADQQMYHSHYAQYGTGPPPQDAGSGMQGDRYGRPFPPPPPGGLYGNFGYG